MKLCALVLAAGKGKRMRTSTIPKINHELLNYPIVKYVLDSISGLKLRNIVMVVGHSSEKVKECVNDGRIIFVNQKEQKGTAHAVKSAFRVLGKFRGNILILNGDSPLIRSNTLKRLLAAHDKDKSKLSFITTKLDSPKGYGRVIRDDNNNVTSIVEEKDATKFQKMINEVNSGIYCVNSDFLWKALKNIKPNNRQSEYYLTDIVKAAKISNLNITTINSNPEEIMGINSRQDLLNISSILSDRINKRLINKGVTIISPDSTYISPQTKIGIDTVIYPNSYIFGETSIGNSCVIGPSVWINNSSLGNASRIRFSSFIEETIIKNGVTVGPFAHIRTGTKVMENAKIGNFVEIKNSSIGYGSKVPHLSYIGDSELGKNVNIGAGSITCNYDGFEKHKTLIEDDVFIGSDTMLVAPIKVGAGATTGAGSTITKDIPRSSLAVARSRQVIVKNWSRKSRNKNK